MKKLYLSLDIGLLNLLKSQLASADIPSLIKNEYPPAAGELSRLIASPELWIIHDEDLNNAANILNETLNKSNHAKEEWKCSHCGERLEGQFELCWNCGTPKK